MMRVGRLPRCGVGDVRIAERLVLRHEDGALPLIGRLRERMLIRAGAGGGAVSDRARCPAIGSGLCVVVSAAAIVMSAGVLGTRLGSLR